MLQNHHIIPQELFDFGKDADSALILQRAGFTKDSELYNLAGLPFSSHSTNAT